MPTLYLRNVPEDVVSALEQRARREGSSVTAVAVRELSEVARRAKNEALLNALPDLDLSTDSIVAAIEDGRAER